jgi:hypothetical protein
MKKQLLNVFAITVIAFTTQAQTVPDYVPTNGLVGYWGFDGDANDYSGNSNDFTNNGAVLTTDRFGNSNAAYSTSTTTGFSKSSAISGGLNFTYSTWVFLASNTNGGFLAETNTVSTSGGGISLDNLVPSFICQGVAINVTNSSTQLMLNQWYNIILTKSDSQFTLYINGSLDSQGSSSYLPHIATTYLGAGKFDGLIDDIAIYNRALTQCEITALYQGHQPPCATSCIVAQYDFSGDANDLSGNGNHGTVNGATLTEDRFGNPNSAYSFDGVDDYIEVSNSLVSSSSSSHTLLGWFKANYNGTTLDIMSDRADPTYSMKYRLAIDETDNGKLTYFSSDGPNLIELNSISSILSDKWYSFSVVYNNDIFKYELYLDGILQHDTTLTSALSNNLANPTNIGRLTGANLPSAYYFKGKLDDIKIYNCALSAAQIDSIFQAEKPCTSYLQQDTITYQVSDAMFNVVGEAVYLDSVITQNYPLGCDSVYEFYSKFVFNATHCTDTVEVLDTIYISVHDTLIIDAVLTGLIAPNNTNTIKVYPNPTSTHIFIDNGDYAKMNGYTIRIDNSLGQTIFNEQITQQQFYVNLSEWTGNGLYFMHIIDNLNNTLETRKIVLQ